MTEAVKKAIESVDNEAEKGGQNAKQIAQYIIDKLITPETAALITAEGKSLSGCVTEITKKAKKEAANNMAMIHQDVVWGWVREYYGIIEEPAPREKMLQFDLASML